jgi:hypothetical protein
MTPALLILALTKAALSRYLNGLLISIVQWCHVSNKRYIRFGANLEGNTTVGGFGVVNSLCSSLNVTANTVVVAGAESLEVVKTVKGDGVFGGVVADGSSVTGHVAFGNIIGRLSANQKSITTQNGVGSESGALSERASLANVRYQAPK